MGPRLIIKNCQVCPWGRDNCSGRGVWGLWGRWWGVTHAKGHMDSTGLSYLVGGCSWHFLANTGTWCCTGPKCGRMVGFLNGARAGPMRRFRALWHVVKKNPEALWHAEFAKLAACIRQPLVVEWVLLQITDARQDREQHTSTELVCTKSQWEPPSA